jgi:3-oxoadipate enol-lactonase
LRLHHRLDGRGEAPVLVLSGSLGTTLAMWEPQLPALTERFRVLRIDHPGHGGTPVPTGPVALDDIGSGVLALLDGLRLERVSFCGLSLGGMLGIWLAARAPERLDRLVLACTSPRFGPPERWRERANAVRTGGMEAVVESVLERWFTARFGEVERYRSMLLATPPEGYARCCEAIRDADLRADLAAVEAQTLVVTGRHDPAVRDEDTRLLLAIPGARRVELDAAHLASVEQPEAFGEAVLEHLGVPAAA